MDEHWPLLVGKNTLDYLFSLGKIDKDIPYAEYYSTIYWSFLYLITELFPSKYETSVSHLVNLFFSFATIFGIGKITSVLFNKKVGIIVFIILFFYPTFFGHMSFNSKDTILTFCHVWIFYLVIKYLKNQNIKDKANNYIIYMGILTALGSSIYFIFISTLIPIFVFVLIEIFFSKNFISNNFKKKNYILILVKFF